MAAARALFAEAGFRGATMRGVARRAGVDSSLVHYFFETKEKLFAAAVEMPTPTPEMVELMGSKQGSPGQRMARLHLEHLFVDRNQAIMALLRAVLGDPDSLPTLRTRIEQTLVPGVADSLEAPDARLRSELTGALMTGLFIVRNIVGVEPLASAPVDDVVALLGPALDALLGPSTRKKRKASP